MSSRKTETRARILALQALYASELHLHSHENSKKGVEGIAENRRVLETQSEQNNHLVQFCDVLEFSWLDSAPKESELFMARLLIEGVRGNLPEMDQLISDKLQNWSLDRLLVLDRTILRLGCYMLKYLKDTPTKVIIDECIELCHNFSGKQSYRLINGVLHSLAEQLRSTAEAQVKLEESQC